MYMYVAICLYMQHVHIIPMEARKIELLPLELELQVAVSHHM